MVFIREGLITKRLENLETKISETICLEVTVSNKKWFILFAYRPPQENNKYVFFNELNETLSKAVNSYENIIVIGDLNINVSILMKIEITIYLILLTLSHYQF